MSKRPLLGDSNLNAMKMLTPAERVALLTATGCNTPNCQVVNANYNRTQFEQIYTAPVPTWKHKSPAEICIPKCDDLPTAALYEQCLIKCAEGFRK